ncbi:MAG TPA: VOC family protein [Jatrophihabitans sp.]|nr:VOC family protein [Jatrophihabitans sp.]
MAGNELVGDLQLATVVLNVQDMARAVRFWTAALGYQPRDLGATRAQDWPYPDDADFVVLRDPDGNEFCVIDHA